jgi:hypothetical protein
MSLIMESSPTMQAQITQFWIFMNARLLTESYRTILGIEQEAITG